MALQHFTGVSLGTTQSRIEAAVVDAIESRQLMSNMRHLVEFDDPEVEEEVLEEMQNSYSNEVTAEEEIIEKHRTAFIKPIQDKIDKEKEEEVRSHNSREREGGGIPLTPHPLTDQETTGTKKEGS